ncbi:MAG TPA: hypothetical protein VFO96_01540 [Gemmatimonadales bacterium]|jgi:hypothetical protein|nr:hypothetical protein [Gemmatimonadales bacterium]
MPSIRSVAIVAIFWMGVPSCGTAQTIRRTTLDSVAVRPAALADSAPVYRAALEGALDSLLAMAGSSRYYIQIAHEAVPSATELIASIIRAGRAKGWCVWDRRDSCPTHGHFAIELGRLTLHTGDSASVPFSIGRVGDKPERNISNTADAWLRWRAMEVGIWPEPHYVIDGAFGIYQPPAIVLRRDGSRWKALALIPRTASPLMIDVGR